MKLSILLILAMLFAFIPIADAKPHKRHGYSSHHYSPRAYRSYGYSGQNYRYGYGHRYYSSDYGYSRRHRHHRGLYINLFGL